MEDNRRKTPKRYGKVQIQKDILKQQGIVLPTQYTLLKLAKVKTLNSTISYRCISDHFKGTSKVSDDNHQKIQEAADTFIKSIEAILS